MHDTYLVLSPGMFFLAIALILLPFWWLYRALLSQYGIRSLNIVHISITLICLRRICILSKTQICEAAHVPVIWATQVLDTLNKSGIATRSEVTDAAHAALAECVMINKGNHIIRTMEALRNILIRSGGHHVKKRYMFRPLSIATRFMTR